MEMQILRLWAGSLGLEVVLLEQEYHIKKVGQSRPLYSTQSHSGASVLLSVWLSGYTKCYCE